AMHQRNYSRRILAAALVLAAMVALPLPPAPGEARGVNVTHTITEQENRGEVTLAPGDTLEVRLEANVTTGFSWQVTQNDRKVLQLQGRPRYEPPAQGQPGAAGHQLFRFRVAGDDGSDAVLQLGY